MRIETVKGSARVEVETSGDWASISLYGSNGYERGSSLHSKDLEAKLEELLKSLTYFRGAKAHATIATRLMIQRINRIKLENKIDRDREKYGEKVRG